MGGRYCSHCGEQRLTPELRSFKHLARDFMTELTSVDGRLWRTLRTLFMKPGRLDLDYHSGKRNVYLQPIPVFLLVNIFFVMFSPITDFYVSFYDQLHSQGYSPYIKPFVEQYIETSGVAAEAFRDAYNQLVVVLARSLIILQVPIFAVLAMLLCAHRERFSGDYFVFALNFHSWLLVWIVVLQVPSIAMGVLGSAFGADLEDPVYFLSLPVGLLVYLWISTGQLFAYDRWQRLWRVPLLFIALLISHYVFRFLQLLITVSLVKV